jgi:UrcA family protein
METRKRKTPMWKMIAAAALLPAAAPACAMAQEGKEAVRVSYGDLDLRRPDDIRRLDARLKIAIDDVCPGGDSIDTWRRIAAEKCRKARHSEIAAARESALARAGRTPHTVASAD